MYEGSHKSIPMVRDFFFPKTVWTGSGAHPTSCLVVPSSFIGAMQPGCAVDHSQANCILHITISTDVHVLIIFLVFQKWLMQLQQVVSYSWKQFIFFKLTSLYYECATFDFTEPFCLFIFSPDVYVHFCSECSKGWTQQIFALYHLNEGKLTWSSLNGYSAVFAAAERVAVKWVNLVKTSYSFLNYRVKHQKHCQSCFLWKLLKPYWSVLVLSSKFGQRNRLKWTLYNEGIPWRYNTEFWSINCCTCTMYESQDSVVSVATMLQARKKGCALFSAGTVGFSLIWNNLTGCGHINPPIQWVLGCFQIWQVWQ